jgi:hypothetical protein
MACWCPVSLLSPPSLWRVWPGAAATISRRYSGPSGRVRRRSRARRDRSGGDPTVASWERTSSAKTRAHLNQVQPSETPRSSPARLSSERPHWPRHPPLRSPLCSATSRPQCRVRGRFRTLAGACMPRPACQRSTAPPGCWQPWASHHQTTPHHSRADHKRSPM